MQDGYFVCKNLLDYLIIWQLQFLSHCWMDGRKKSQRFYSRADGGAFSVTPEKIRDLKKIKQNWSVYVQMYIDYLRKSIHYAPSVSRSGFIFNHQWEDSAKTK